MIWTSSFVSLIIYYFKHVQASGFELLPGECARVNTGGPLPDNADAVVQVS